MLKDYRDGKMLGCRMPPPPEAEKARDAPGDRRSSSADTPAPPRPQPPSWQVDDWE
jgi:hypothetical protein